jgi:methylated-DNA-[protein]-cysteine S-methyltransferase
METLVMDSPLGPLHITGDDTCIHRIEIGGGPDATGETPVMRRAAEQLVAYFSGDRREFDLPLVAPATPFQEKVRAAMCAIPYGETKSYGEIAKQIGGVPRAVGQACGANPVPIVVPCHRVLGAGGSIGGFSGGTGTPTKRKLLALEAGPLFAPAAPR